MDEVGRTQETSDVDDENQHSRDAERMRLDRRHELPARKIRNRMPKTTPRTERDAKRLERTEAEQMRSARIHRRHGREAHDPRDGFDHPAPPPPV